ncbi:hypothetical protein TrRE_jg5430 [Triparma retinervis]|uniref:Uncharacterized protein n=1 Tax=Triparma retinervis TaxID=2557542 RepID=A0A9W7DZX2_9STRA|nr:hypothetical protein TrRE_jg5430 [Triparma retinervis]
MSQETRLNRLLTRVKKLEEYIGIQEGVAGGGGGGNTNGGANDNLDSRLKAVEEKMEREVGREEVMKHWDGVDEMMEELGGIEGRGEEGIKDMMEVVVSCSDDYSALLSNLSSVKQAYANGRILSDEARFALPPPQAERLRKVQEEVGGVMQRKEKVEERTDGLVDINFRIVKGVNEGIGGIMG